jgi:hypothetical protein
MSDDTTNTEKLKTKSQRAIEEIERQSGRKAPAKAKPRPHAEARGMGRSFSNANRAALAKQLKARILAAEKSGNVSMATDTRKKLAALLTQKQ